MQNKKGEKRKMPTYEYECKSCGYVFEQFQSMTEKPLQTCPECEGKVKRIIGAGAGIIFKGSGFYETDYKKKSPSSSDSFTTSADKDKSSDTKPPSNEKPNKKDKKTSSDK